VNPMVKGAFREPGEMTKSRIPFALQCKTTDWAEGMLEYFIETKIQRHSLLTQNSLIYYSSAIIRIMVANFETVSSHSFSGLESLVIPPPA